MILSGSVNYHDQLRPLLVPIDSVTQHEENYNNGDVDMVIDSIMQSGMYRPIYVQTSTGKIVAGNHTWMACKQLGADVIPVVRIDIDDSTALRLMVDDNEIARRARPDHGQLLAILDTLQATSHLPVSINENQLEQIRALAEVPFEDDTKHKSWPTLTFQVPPHIKKAFLDMTSMAGGDRERFELLLRLAGWRG